MAATVASDLLSPQEAEAILRSIAGERSSSPMPPRVRAPARREQDIRPIPIQDDRSGMWRAEQRYRALIEQIPVVTFMAALDETIHELYVSPQIETLLGFSQREWLDDPFLWYYQLHPEDRERWQTEFARTCATGVRFRSEYRFIARDGRVVWVHGECEVIRDEIGRPIFLQGVAYDITESKKAEEVLQRIGRDLETMVQQRTAELAQVNEALRVEVRERQQAQHALSRQATELARSNMELSQFAYVASHDLQEPLRMMASFAQLLADRYRGKLDNDADEYIHYISDGASRMQRLIKDLLQYSRVGQAEVGRMPVDCSAVLVAALANLQARIGETGAKVTAEPLPVVPGDETLLILLFQNLIGNAIKFARPGVSPEVHVSAALQGAEWLFSVRDNGIGFDAQYAEKIFLIFQRLHSRARYPGTGIGLAVCRKIVERHGGRIWAESEQGRGSIFYFTLKGSAGSDEQQ